MLDAIWTHWLTFNASCLFLKIYDVKRSSWRIRFFTLLIGHKTNQYCNSSNKLNVGSYILIEFNDGVDVFRPIGAVYLMVERYLIISKMFLMNDYHFLGDLGSLDVLLLEEFFIDLV